MMPERITSRSNARVRALRSVLQSRRGEQVGIEGFHLLREAIASGLTLTTVFLRDDQASLLDKMPSPDVAEVVLLSREAFESASATEQAQGVAAVLQRPEIPYEPRSGDLLLVADGIQDPGNLGTLVRSAEAFGAAAVALAQNTVDPWNGKCLRAAAGAVFRLPLPSWNGDLLAALHAVDARVYAAVAHGGEPAHLTDLRGTTVLVIGNEAAGVSPNLLSIAHKHITLASTGPTESLNAAIAGSLLLYEASQQRMRGLA
jgi:TrmH family RNA methyltransferase